MRCTLFEKWNEKATAISFPNNMDLSKHAVDLYIYCKNVVHSLLSKNELMPEFASIVEYTKQLFDVDVCGILVEPRRDEKTKKVTYNYHIGTLSSGVSEIVERDDYSHKIEQLTEFVVSIMNEPNIVSCVLCDDRKWLKWMFMVDSVNELKPHLLKEFDLYDVRINAYDKIEVVFNLDNDLITSRKDGLIDMIAKRIYDTYLERKCIENDLENVEYKFTSFESECEPVQNPVKLVKSLFGGRRLMLDMNKTYENKHPTSGSMRVSLKVYTDARGYIVLEEIWEVHTGDKTNELWRNDKFHVYPPETIINDENCWDFLFDGKNSDNYPIVTMSFPKGQDKGN